MGGSEQDIFLFVCHWPSCLHHIIPQTHQKICACNELSSSGLILFMHTRSIPHDLFAPTCIFRLILHVLSVEQPKLLSLIICLIFDFHEKQKESYTIKKSVKHCIRYAINDSIFYTQCMRISFTCVFAHINIMVVNNHKKKLMHCLILMIHGS